MAAKNDDLYLARSIDPLLTAWKWGSFTDYHGIHNDLLLNRHKIHCLHNTTKI